MEILKKLKNIDFKTQYLEILFTDNTVFKTPFLINSEDDYLKNLPKISINKDNSVTIETNNAFIYFQLQAVLRIKIGKITF